MTREALLSIDDLLLLFGVSLFLLATMGVYAGRCATIGPLPGAADCGPSIIPAWFRSWWRWLWWPVVRACLRLGIPAVGVALLGVTASAFAAIAVVSRSVGFGGWMYLAAATLAGIGGELARAEGQPSRAAALLDGTLGRLAELLFLGALAYAVRAHDGALVAALSAIGATMLASDARLRSEAMGAGVSSGHAAWFGRSERALLVALPCAVVPLADAHFHAGAGLDVVAATLGLVAALGAVSAVRRLHSGHEALRTIDTLSAAQREPSRRLRVVRGGRA